ncbi:MAG TPA: helix-turn-helix transcriptional regulator [Candidatus Limnocylindrales bacterium]|nr:helix-turn-helix transcriptional regulator [Candidatus Limnocylindrales bacterium]
MSTRERAVTMGEGDARRVAQYAANEVRIARHAHNMSQATAAARAGMSRQQFGRIERASLHAPTVDQLCRAARAVGLQPAFQLHAGEIRVRDRASLAMFQRFERMLHPSFLPARREVPLPIPGDRRAWDLRIRNGAGTASVEGESRIGDTQALARRIERKRRDDPQAGIVILLVNKTAHNRDVLRAHREVFRELLPLDGAEVWRALRRGELPRANGIVLV